MSEEKRAKTLTSHLINAYIKVGNYMGYFWKKEYLNLVDKEIKEYELKGFDMSNHRSYHNKLETQLNQIGGNTKCKKP